MMMLSLMQDWRLKLGKDPQKRADNKAFAPREQQTLFEKHVQGLAVHIEQDYRRLMDQVCSLLHVRLSIIVVAC